MKKVLKKMSRHYDYATNELSSLHASYAARTDSWKQSNEGILFIEQIYELTRAVDQLGRVIDALYYYLALESKRHDISRSQSRD